MPGDSNIRVSARPRPLKALFSKYAPQAPNTSLPVRPLGVVRRPSSSQSSGRSNLPPEQELSDIERVCLYLEGGGMDGNKIPYLASAKYLAEVLKSPRDGKNLPRLSKSQTFEHQYKLAASRDLLNGSQVPSRSKARRLITLPMYQLKVNTNNPEMDDSEAVESTRKSLKNLMEVGKVNASHPDNGVMTANIKNFRFAELGNNFECNGYPSSSRFKPLRFGGSQCKENKVMSAPTIVISDKLKNPLSLTVHSSSEPDQPLNADSKSWVSENKSSVHQVDVRSLMQSDLDRMDVRLESVAYTPTVAAKSAKSRGKFRQLTPSKSEKSVSFRDEKILTSPATKITTSTTLDYLNRTTPFVPWAPFDNECRRSAPESIESSSPLQVWPSLKDIHKMKIEACRQAVCARRQRRHKSSGTVSSTSCSEVHVPAPKASPRLRYTKQSRGHVLDPIPIIVPSHTTIDCPMCKLHLCFPDTSSCPPNSPTIETSSSPRESPIQLYSQDGMVSHAPRESPIQLYSQDGMVSHADSSFEHSNAIVIPTAQVIDDDPNQRLSPRESLSSETSEKDMDGQNETALPCIADKLISNGESQRPEIQEDAIMCIDQ